MQEVQVTFTDNMVQIDLTLQEWGYLKWFWENGTAEKFKDSEKLEPMKLVSLIASYKSRTQMYRLSTATGVMEVLMHRFKHPKLKENLSWRFNQLQIWTRVVDFKIDQKYAY
jgi:hypothetical protein